MKGRSVLTGALVASLAIAWSADVPASGHARLDGHAYRGTPVKVSIRHFAYHPRALDIERGAEVVFVNHDSAPHNARRAGSFSTGLLRSGHSAALRFNHRGVYRYYCSLHPSMRGKIIVH